MSSFLNLPDELIELIGDASNTQGDLLALSRTCQACYSILKPRLIAYNIRNHQSSGLRDAARRNDIDLAREFLRRKGVDVNSTAFHRPGVWETPLLFAMECGHEDMAVLLLEHGADHDMGVRVHSPGFFFEACTRERLRVVRKLVGMGCVPDFRGFPLCSYGVTSLPIVEILLDCFDAQVPSPDREQLFQVLYQEASNGAADVVRMLLARGVPANPPGFMVFGSNVPLYAAILRRAPEVAGLLLQNGADLCYNLGDLRQIVGILWQLLPLPEEDDFRRQQQELLELL